jgi:hypothetical protein
VGIDDSSRDAKAPYAWLKLPAGATKLLVLALKLPQGVLSLPYAFAKLLQQKMRFLLAAEGYGAPTETPQAAKRAQLSIGSMSGVRPRGWRSREGISGQCLANQLSS